VQVQLAADVDSAGDVAIASHAEQADDAWREYVLAGQVWQAVARGAANVPAEHTISVETLGQAEPSAHARHEMGVVVRLFCT